MLIFFNPCPQGGWELLLDLPELGHFPPTPIPSIPYRACLHPIPPKAPEAGDLVSSASSVTDPMALAHPCPLNQCLHMYDATWGGADSSCLSMAYSFYPVPRLPNILSSRPMAGPPGRTGEGGEGRKTMDTLFCFVFKENTVYFRLTETFRALLCSIHPSVCPKYQAARVGPETAPLLSSVAQFPEG